MCARKESMNFDIVWDYCIKEETRVANREDLLKEGKPQGFSTSQEVPKENRKQSEKILLPISMLQLSQDKTHY